MKILKIKKKGQSVVEFAFVFILVGVVGGAAFVAMNPDLFRGYFENSVSSNSGIDSTGQMTLCTYDDNDCTTPIAPPPPPPPASCVAMALGGTEADGTIYVGNDGINDLCMTANDNGLWAWGPTCLITGATSNSDGQANTTVLVGLGANYVAAKICDDLVTLGHDDWYLPSINELGIIYLLYVSNPASGNFNSTNSAMLHHYWSSTQHDNDEAKVVDFYQQIASQNKEKTEIHSIRCVRHD